MGYKKTAEREVLVTVSHCRSHRKDHKLKGAPPGSDEGASPSEWMTGELFLSVLKHFGKHERSTKDQPKLIILDILDSAVLNL
ncbi:hypothetical protein PR048_011157 [Dryococelus australis]|uniref:Uncharacterized protein n=1 Tax=Dryococelus australis TaxID=614101 RepID=A0ABQ9HLI9_9NEOP|nr:hypothetical protein PR048_011157 [Dryococelus australis]